MIWTSVVGFMVVPPGSAAAGKRDNSRIWPVLVEDALGAARASEVLVACALPVVKPLSARNRLVCDGSSVWSPLGPKTIA
jgi:hypothetical protein